MSYYMLYQKVMLNKYKKRILLVIIVTIIFL